jgi:aspartyl-tRNA(Asn)/glutamyl-tRNA(Gln) amidotransferase subunit A
LAACQDPHPPAKVLWSPTLGYASVDDEVLATCERAVSVLESLGTEVIEIDSVFDTNPFESWVTLAGVYLLRSIGQRAGEPDSSERDPLLTYLLEAAESVTGVQMAEALDACHRINVRLVELFSEARILITPTCAGLAPPLSLGGAGLINGERSADWVSFTYPFNMSGSPAATICAGLSASGLPVGLQLVGPSQGDLVVIRTAAALEAALGFDQLAPVD